MQSLPCPYDYLPDDPLLDDAAGLALLAQSLHADGDDGTAGAADAAGLERALQQPGVRAAVHSIMRRQAATADTATPPA